jgi:pyruvate dehydrogenase E1 component alpha subunit
MAKTAEKKSKFSKEQYLKWYESMLLMRKFEEKTGQVYVQQKIKGFCHLYIGQEAIVAGTVSATKKEDKHITAYRCHAPGIGLGMQVKVVRCIFLVRNIILLADMVLLADKFL